MSTRRQQRSRFANTAVRSAARAVSTAVKTVARAARNYRPSSGMRMAARSVGSGLVGYPSYKYGKAIYRKVRKTIQSDPAASGNELTRYKTNVGRYPKLKPQRLMKLMQAGMTDIVFRAQGITNFDTNVGYYPLANRETSTGSVIIPMHVWDLTTLPNTDNAVAPGGGFNWNNQLATAVADRYALRLQNADGSNNPLGYWQIEKSSGAKSGTTTVPLHAAKACHEWSDIRLNLYGARKRGTTYYIDIVRCIDDFANPVSANVGNKEYNDLIRTLQSNLIYSNLQSHNIRNMKCLRFVKRFKFYVPGGSQDDLDTIGKIKEFRLFLKQGNVYNYEWQSSSTEERLPHAQTDGIDYVDNEGPTNYPRHRSRLLMFIRAFSPERRTLTAGQDSQTTEADPLTEPSYDLIIRNKWLLPH